MPVPTNNSRPSLPYAPTQSLPNNARFDILTTTQRPPSAEMLDAEFNALTDDVNTLAAAINAVQAGSIPGADDPLNANKVLKTDGANNLSWTYVTNAEIEANAVVEQKLAAQSVTTSKIGDAAVTTQKIAQNAVATNQIIDANITTPKLADGSVITQKLGDNAVTTQKLANQAVTQGQIANTAVGTAQLIDANVTTDKLANNAVTTAKIADNAVVTANITNQAVTQTQLANNSVGTNQLIDAHVTTVKLSNQCVTLQKLDPTVVQGLVIAAGSFNIKNYVPTLSYSFGITGVEYVPSSGTYFKITYNKTYTRPPILTATATVISTGTQINVCIQEAAVNFTTLNVFPQGTGNQGLIYFQVVDVS